MKIISTNIGQRTKVEWKGKEIETGIYKYPSSESITLGFEDVVGDHVIDRRYHGGFDKACYCYSTDHYDFWKEKYPDLDWNWGMFGENLSIEGLDESKIFIGDVYQIGEAKVQLSKPRRPCFKLGIRFGTQQALKDFIEAPYPGIYLKIIEEGAVQVGDEFQLVERPTNSITVLEAYQLLYAKEMDQEVIDRALACEWLTGSQRDTILKKWGKSADN